MRLKVYAADTSVLCNSDLFGVLYSKVSESRRIKTDRMCNQRGKRLSLGVEFLLMCACSDFGIDYGRMDFVEDKFSKPAFKCCGLHFNLSHSGDRAMCIMSDVAVGCDVERVRSANMAVAERFFSKDECAAVKSDDDFYRIWTQKESYIKCTGLGMSVPLASFSVLDVAKCAEYSLFAPDAVDGYRYAWCVKNSDEKYTKLDEIEWKSILA